MDSRAPRRDYANIHLLILSIACPSFRSSHQSIFAKLTLPKSSKTQKKNLFIQHLDIIHTNATPPIFPNPLLTYNRQLITFIDTKNKKDWSTTHSLVTFYFWLFDIFSLIIYLCEIPSYSDSSHTNSLFIPNLNNYQLWFFSYSKFKKSLILVFRKFFKMK